MLICVCRLYDFDTVEPLNSGIAVVRAFFVLMINFESFRYSKVQIIVKSIHGTDHISVVRSEAPCIPLLGVSFVERFDCSF